MLEYLFKKYIALKDVFLGDEFVKWIHVIGGTMITISFFIVGYICFTMAKLSRTPPRTKKSIVVTQLFGMFLISCSISRGLEVISIWYNYALIDGFVKVITGLLAIGAITYLPGMIREARRQTTINDINDKLTNTTDKLEKLKELNDKLSS